MARERFYYSLFGQEHLYGTASLVSTRDVFLEENFSKNCTALT